MPSDMETVVILNALFQVVTISSVEAFRFCRRHQHAALAIGQHDVGLRRKSVADMRDIAHVNRRAIYSFYRQIVQARHGLRAAVHLHHVFQRS